MLTEISVPSGFTEVIERESRPALVIRRSCGLSVLAPVLALCACGVVLFQHCADALLGGFTQFFFFGSPFVPFPPIWSLSQGRKCSNSVLPGGIVRHGGQAYQAVVRRYPFQVYCCRKRKEFEVVESSPEGGPASTGLVDARRLG